MNIPRWMLRHSVTVETRTGAGGYGDVYAAPVALNRQVLVDDTRRLVRDINTGQQVVSNSTVYARVDTQSLWTPGTRVTLGSGRKTTVIAVDVNDGGGLPTPDHVAVSLT